MTAPPTGPASPERGDPTRTATLLRQWRHTAERWRLTRGEAAALLHVRRAILVGTAPRGPLDVDTAARMATLVALDEALLARTGSPALTARWIRFPSTTRPNVRRLDLLAGPDDFLRAALNLLGRA